MRARVTPAQIRALLDIAALDAESADVQTEPSSRQKRAAAASSIPPALLERYDALLGRRRSPIVAAAERGCCSGCHIRLPAVLWHEIRKAPGVFGCPHCGRLLYDPAHLSASTGQPQAPATCGVKR